MQHFRAALSWDSGSVILKAHINMLASMCAACKNAVQRGSSPKTLATMLRERSKSQGIYTAKLKAPPIEQGSLHYTPEHCLVNAGLPVFWVLKKQPVSNGGKK